MGRIHLLEDDIINKIAAGEVVERPASVLKELLENSVDAGSTEIHVELEEGGKRRLTVRDLGKGMSQEDLKMSLKRHATSKISSLDDLFQIESMGFRGEALASIASVSEFTISSRSSEEPDAQGMSLKCHGGASQELLPWNGACGTVVNVENLFFNVPARAKFLKSDASEYAHCFELVQSVALAHPGITVTLSHNGKEKLRVPAVCQGVSFSSQCLMGEDILRKRIAAVWGRELAEALIYVSEEDSWGRFEGFISPPGVEKATSKNMITFVNRRWVKDQVLRYGILRGYHSHLLKGRFPQVVAFYQCDPTLVDANVHPRKTELRFQYSSEVQSLIALAIRNGIRDGQWASGADTFNEKKQSESGSSAKSFQQKIGQDLNDDDPVDQKIFHSAAERYANKTVQSGSGQSRSFSAGAIRSDSGPGKLMSGRNPDRGRIRSFEGYSGPETSKPTEEPGVAVKRLFPSASNEDSVSEKSDAIPWDSLTYQGQLFKCYLMFETEDRRLLVIDQHAFHERILFERLLNDPDLLKKKQPLIVPEVLELSAAQAEKLRDRETLIRNAGFDFEWISDFCPEIRSVPGLLAGCALDGLFEELTQEGQNAQDGSEAVQALGHQILATIACHSAIRAGDEPGERDLNDLISQAKTVDFYHNCPHGRRVFKWFKESEVEAWFDRV